MFSLSYRILSEYNKKALRGISLSAFAYLETYYMHLLFSRQRQKSTQYFCKFIKFLLNLTFLCKCFIIWYDFKTLNK